MNFIFLYIGNFIIPTDEVIFCRGVGQPPTRNSWGVDTNPFDSHQNWVRPLLGGTSSCTNSSTAPVCCEAQESPNGMGAPEFLPKSWLLETMVWDWCCFFCFWAFLFFLGMQSCFFWEFCSTFVSASLPRWIIFCGGHSQLTFSDFSWIHFLDLALGLVILLPFFSILMMNSQWPFFWLAILICFSFWVCKLENHPIASFICKHKRYLVTFLYESIPLSSWLK